ncbi:hypothetical protein EGW08_003396, partial [Elysia chlorotica]
CQQTVTKEVESQTECGIPNPHADPDPHPHYDTAVPRPQDVHLYHTGFDDVYENTVDVADVTGVQYPADVEGVRYVTGVTDVTDASLRESGTYMIPDCTGRHAPEPEPDFYELKQSSGSTSSVPDTAETSTYNNLNYAMSKCR